MVVGDAEGDGVVEVGGVVSGVRGGALDVEVMQDGECGAHGDDGGDEFVDEADVFGWNDHRK